MPFPRRRRAELKLSDDVKAALDRISRSRTEPAHRIERAQMLLHYARGATVSSIARTLHTHRPKIERCIDKALQLGPLAALEDIPRSGRLAQIPPEARAWVVSLACQKPKALGYPEELWTTCLLVAHVREHASAAGYPSLAKRSRGTVSRILSRHEIQPHKIHYFRERRETQFEDRMRQVIVRLSLGRHAAHPKR